MATTITHQQSWDGSELTVLSTAMNSLANGSRALTAGITPPSGNCRMDIELVVPYSTAPAANGAVEIYVVRQLDGVNYEDGGASVTPTSLPIVCGLRAVTGTQRIIRSRSCPVGEFLLLLVNAAGQTIGSGGSLKVRFRKETSEVP